MKTKQWFFPVLAILVVIAFQAMPEIAEAAKIQKPDFVEDVDTGKLNAAGAEINKWIFALIAIAIACFASWPGYLFISGKPEEAWEKAKYILLGVGFVAVFGGIVFAVATRF